MTTFWRLHPADEDPAWLLDPARQRSEPWEGGDDGRCDKCGGSGETEHECQSCRWQGADPACPACGGRVRYVAECPVCGGDGEIDGDPREGVSVFPRLEGLVRYMERRDATLEGSVLVELEGFESGERDFDADEGALLVRPTRIVSTRPVDAALAAELLSRAAAGSTG